eukprot:15432184-Alexandrium_andersonii.AAC.1
MGVPDCARPHLQAFSVCSHLSQIAAPSRRLAPQPSQTRLGHAPLTGCGLAVRAFFTPRWAHR